MGRSLKHLSVAYGVVLAGVLANVAVAQEPQHFSPKGKMPSQYTIEAQQQQRRILPLADKQDFQEAKRGFIAAPPYRKIMNDEGGVAWDIDNWDFLLNGKDYDSIHPSLQRQALLNMEYGLFEVVPGIYQVRGFDLANISFIRGNTGWIVIDPLTVKETSRAALKFINERLGERPVVAVIVSHSHGDHFGGIRGVVDDAALAAGKVQIIAPKGFINEAIAENLYAGNAMTRRKSYTYGDILPPSPYGQVDASIGKARCERRCRHPAPDQEHRTADRGTDDRRRADGFPEHSGHRSACGNEHLVSGSQGILGRGEHRRQPAQHPHAAWSAGA